MKPRRLERTIIYQNPWLNLYRDKVQMPNGHIIEQHHLLEFGHPAVACLAENQAGQVVLCKICRYTTGESSWEVPAGRMEAGETVQQAAARELLEETGCTTADLKPVYTYHPIPGISGWSFTILHTKVSRCGDILDKNEVSQVGWFSREDVRQMLAEHQITCGLTLTGLLLWLNGQPD